MSSPNETEVILGIPCSSEAIGVYFDQCMGVAHSKRWSTFFVLKAEKGRKSQNFAAKFSKKKGL